MDKEKNFAETPSWGLTVQKNVKFCNGKFANGFNVFLIIAYVSKRGILIIQGRFLMENWTSLIKTRITILVHLDESIFLQELVMQSFSQKSSFQ